MIQRKTLWRLLALFTVLLFLECPRSWLFDPDEARYTEIPREMLATGDFLTPRLNGSHYFEKPPLLYWLNAGARRMGGTSPFMARLTTRLATVGTSLLLLLLLGGATVPEISLWAALAYLSSLLPFALGRLNTTDTLITFALTLTLLSFRRFSMARETGQPAGAALSGVGVGMALGMLSKGLIGIVLPGLVIVLWCGATSRWRRISELIFSRATILFIAIAAPWFILMEKAHPGFLFFFFVHEHLLRYATSSANRPGGNDYFVPVVIFGLLPWTWFLFPTLKKVWAQRAQRFAHVRDETFFVVWFGAVIVFFSASHSKLVPYVLPAFPAAAVLVAMALQPRHHKMMNRVLIGMAGLYVALIALQPSLAKRRSLHEIGVQAKRTGAQHIVAFKTYPQSLPLEVGHPIIVVGYQGELASDDVLDPKLFWTPTHFRYVWNSTQTVTAVFREEEWPRLPKHQKTHVVLKNRGYVVVSNFIPAQ